MQNSLAVVTTKNISPSEDNNMVSAQDSQRLCNGMMELFLAINTDGGYTGFQVVFVASKLNTTWTRPICHLDPKIFAEV